MRFRLIMIGISAAGAACGAAIGQPETEAVIPCGGAGQPLCGTMRPTAVGLAHAAAAIGAELADCYRSNVLRLGSNNSEAGSFVVQAARSICQPVADRLYQARLAAFYGDGVAAAAYTQGERGRAEDAAAATLLEARRRSLATAR